MGEAEDRFYTSVSDFKRVWKPPSKQAETLFPDPEQAPDPVDVRSENSDGDTPLYVAAIWGDRHAVSVLLDAGADLRAKGDMRWRNRCSNGALTLTP